MQGNVNPIAAYEAGSRLANQMLNVQSQQAQQVFQNLYNSAQQAENRRQFEQTMAFRETQAADESARGWFNAKTQRMAYDPNRGKAEGPPISAMNPIERNLEGGGRVVFLPSERGGRWVMPPANATGSTKSQSPSAFPPGISFSGDPTMPNANDVIPIPSGSPEPTSEPVNPLFNLQPERPSFDADSNYIPGNAAPGETGGGDPETYGAPTGGMAPPAQSGLVPPRPIPPASVINAPAPQAQPANLGINQSIPPADIITPPVGLSPSIPPIEPPILGGNVGIDARTSELLSEQPTGRTTAKSSWLSQVPDYVRQGKDRLEAGETMRVNRGGYTEEIMLRNGAPVSRTFENDGKPIGDGTFKPLAPPQTFNIDIANPQSIMGVTSLVEKFGDRVDMSANVDEEGRVSLSVKPLTVSGGTGTVKDMSKAKSVNEFIGAIPDTTLRERAVNLYSQIADPTQGKGDGELRADIMVERGIEEAAVTPSMINERKNMIRMESAQALTALGAGLNNGSTPWAGPQGLMEQMGFIVKQPPPAADGEVPPTPSVVPRPKTPETLAKEAELKAKARDFNQEYTNIKGNFEKQLLQNYSEKDLDGVAAGIHFKESGNIKTRDTVGGFPMPTQGGYILDVLQKLGLKPFQKIAERPDATFFKSLRAEDVARMWARDRLTRSKVLDQDGTELSKSTPRAQAPRAGAMPPSGANTTPSGNAFTPK
jgi:cation transport regulator ChaB